MCLSPSSLHINTDAHTDVASLIHSCVNFVAAMQEVHSHVGPSGAGHTGVVANLDAANVDIECPDAVQSGGSLEETDLPMISEEQADACVSGATAAGDLPTQPSGLKVRV
jgi:hypothetical protein